MDWRLENGVMEGDGASYMVWHVLALVWEGSWLGCWASKAVVVMPGWKSVVMISVWVEVMRVAYSRVRWVRGAGSKKYMKTLEAIPKNPISLSLLLLIPDNGEYNVKMLQPSSRSSS